MIKQAYKRGRQENPRLRWIGNGSQRRSEGQCATYNDLSAFTLMELMIVILLIGVMAAIIIPEMRGSVEESLLRSSGRKLADAFNLASSRAVTLNQVHRVRLDTAKGRFVIEKQVAETGEPSDFEPAKDMDDFAGEIDSRILVAIRPLDMSNGTEEETDSEAPLNDPVRDGIGFYTDGTADGCEITLRDRMGFQLVLQLNPTTARAHFVEKEGM